MLCLDGVDSKRLLIMTVTSAKMNLLQVFPWLFPFSSRCYCHWYGRHNGWISLVSISLISPFFVCLFLRQSCSFPLINPLETSWLSYIDFLGVVLTLLEKLYTLRISSRAFWKYTINSICIRSWIRVVRRFISTACGTYTTATDISRHGDSMQHTAQHSTSLSSDYEYDCLFVGSQLLYTRARTLFAVRLLVRRMGETLSEGPLLFLFVHSLRGWEVRCFLSHTSPRIHRVHTHTQKECVREEIWKKFFFALPTYFRTYSTALSVPTHFASLTQTQDIGSNDSLVARPTRLRLRAMNFGLRSSPRERLLTHRDGGFDARRRSNHLAGFLTLTSLPSFFLVRLL